VAIVKRDASCFTASALTQVIARLGRLADHRRRLVRSLRGGHRQ
jgi:hypothetical protein